MQFRLTRSVKALSIAFFVMFLLHHTLEQFMGVNVSGWLALVPAGFMLDHRFWQIITYSFLHGDVMHLVLNLMMLVFIGSELEAAWGSAKFLRFYFTCVLAGGVAYLLLQAFINSEAALHSPMVGASAGIYGMLVAYGILFGERVMLFMMLFPMKAKHFVWILAGIEFMSTVFSSRNGVAGVAHIGGMAAGFLYLWTKASWVVWSRRRESAAALRPKKKRSADHLKLVVNRDPRDPQDPRAAGPRSSGAGSDDDEPKTWH